MAVSLHFVWLSVTVHAALQITRSYDFYRAVCPNRLSYVHFFSIVFFIHSTISHRVIQVDCISLYGAWLLVTV